jgi:hypothetical protein
MNAGARFPLMVLVTAALVSAGTFVTVRALDDPARQQAAVPRPASIPTLGPTPSARVNGSAAPHSLPGLQSEPTAAPTATATATATFVAPQQDGDTGGDNGGDTGGGG